MGYMESAVRVAVGLVLLTAAVAKLSSFSRFTQLLTEWAGSTRATLLGTMVVGCEAVLGVTLVAGIYVTIAGALSATLFSVFATWLSWTIVAHRATKCGCFGDLGRVTWSKVSANLGFVALSIGISRSEVFPFAAAAAVLLFAGPKLGVAAFYQRVLSDRHPSTLRQ